MTRAEMLERMSSYELSEWMAFYLLEPFGIEAEYVGHAITASTVANMNRPKGRKAYTVEEFIPRKKKKQSMDDMKQIAELMTIGLGGKDLRDHG